MATMRKRGGAEAASPIESGPSAFPAGSGTRQPLLIVETAPEELFRVARVTETDGLVSSSMPIGAWLERGDSQVPAGSLGVLVDNVLGYAVLVDRPPNHWSVSSEISIDICGPIEPGGTLFGSARPVRSDSRGSVTSGEVVDEQGRVVAVCRQHGRYVPGLPDFAQPGRAVRSRAEVPTDPGSVHDLLGRAPVPEGEAATLDLAATSALVNPLGNVHGGITLLAADLTALAAMEAAGQPMTTASIHVAYVRPIPLGSTARFEATVVHQGRTFAVARVEARNAAGKLCATATVTAAAR